MFGTAVGVPFAVHTAGHASTGHFSYVSRLSPSSASSSPIYSTFVPPTRIVPAPPANVVSATRSVVSNRSPTAVHTPPTVPPPPATTTCVPTSAEFHCHCPTPPVTTDPNAPPTTSAKRVYAAANPLHGAAIHVHKTSLSKIRMERLVTTQISAPN